MTQNIDFTTAKKVQEQRAIRKSIEVVEYHILKLEESFDQLESIFRLNVSKDIKKEAYNFLLKQEKLIEVAQNLKQRFKSLRSLRILNSVEKDKDYDLDQLAIELDLLNEMHFRLKKSYFSFINKYYVRTTASQLMIA